MNERVILNRLRTDKLNRATRLAYTGRVGHVKMLCMGRALERYRRVPAKADGKSRSGRVSF